MDTLGTSVLSIIRSRVVPSLEVLTCIQLLVGGTQFVHCILGGCPLFGVSTVGGSNSIIAIMSCVVVLDVARPIKMYNDLITIFTQHMQWGLLYKEQSDMQWSILHTIRKMVLYIDTL